MLEEATAAKAVDEEGREWTLEDFIKMHTSFCCSTYSPEDHRWWAEFHYKIYLEDGTLPDFVRLNEKPA